MPGRFHRFHLGHFECLAVLDMHRVGKWEEFFPHIDPQALSAVARAQGSNPEAVSFFSATLVVNSGDQWLLLDAGNPQGEAAASGKLVYGLRAAGISPEEIGVIVISHCHPDHIGGLTDDKGNLIYPNARYVMCKEEWQYWFDQPDLSLWGEAYGDFLRVRLLPIEDKITFVDREIEIVPGISVEFLLGHTPGHIGVRLDSAGEQLLTIVDAALAMVQLARPEWSPRHDVDPELAAVTRRRLFQQAAHEKLLVMGYHFPFPGLGHIVAQGDAFQWQPVEA